MKKTLPKSWEVRVTSEFLWFPVGINGEVRWLEHAFYLEEYYRRDRSWFGFWEPIRWLSSEEAAQLQMQGNSFATKYAAFEAITQFSKSSGES